jgi:hypothetical protein
MPHPVYKVFISSTFLDLAPERRLVLQAIQDLNTALTTLGIALLPIDLQRGAETKPPLEVCLAETSRSDIIITIIGRRYGSVSSTGLSVTEMEFDEATRRGVQRLAYYKDDAAILLPEHMEADSEMVNRLISFRKKIDAQLKRDTFANADELRGHVIRDLMKWLLAHPEIAKGIPSSAAAAAFLGSRSIFEAFSSGQWLVAADLLSSRQSRLDMKRFGLESLFLGLLQDLLELGSLLPPRKIIEPGARAQLLLMYVGEAGDTFSAQVALEQAASLEGKIKDLRYSFEVALARAKNIVAATNRYELALPVSKELLRYGWRTRDLHRIAQSRSAVALYYTFKGEHRRALRWWWRTIDELCRMQQMCGFCLCDAFIAAGNEHLALGECVLADNRYGKALMIALMIPNRERQVKALHCLGRHLSWHNDLHHGIAAYVWLSRVCREIDPCREDADLGVLLGEFVVKHGSAVVREHLNAVEARAEEVVREALAPHDVESFTAKLGLEPSTAGDHW